MPAPTPKTSAPLKMTGKQLADMAKKKGKGMPKKVTMADMMERC